MAKSAAQLVDEVLPEQPMCRWVLSFPYPLRFLERQGLLERDTENSYLSLSGPHCQSYRYRPHRK